MGLASSRENTLSDPAGPTSFAHSGTARGARPRRADHDHCGDRNGPAVDTGVAGAQPKAGQQSALCQQVEARLHVLLGQYLRTKDLKRLNRIYEESQQLQDCYTTYCADATEPAK